MGFYLNVGPHLNVDLGYLPGNPQALPQQLDVLPPPATGNPIFDQGGLAHHPFPHVDQGGPLPQFLQYNLLAPQDQDPGYVYVPDILLGVVPHIPLGPVPFPVLETPAGQQGLDLHPLQTDGHEQQYPIAQGSPPPPPPPPPQVLARDQGVTAVPLGPEDELPSTFRDKDTHEEFRRLGYLGGGTFGKVVVVKDHKKKKSALKIPTAESNRELIEAERTFLKKVRGCPNVVKFLGAVDDPEVGLCLRVELCLKKDLSELLHKRRALTVQECRFFGRQLVRGLTHIHKKKIIHRDLKPANILVGEGMVLKISDFGWAMKKLARDKAVKGIAGTIGYAAPEIFLDQAHDFIFDVFSLGIIMFEMLTGKRPDMTPEILAQGSLGEDFKGFPDVEFAENFLEKALKFAPGDRASLNELGGHDFLQRGICPTTLPESVFEKKPIFDDGGDEAGGGAASEDQVSVVEADPSEEEAENETRAKGKAKRVASASHGDDKSSAEQHGKSLTSETEKERRAKGKETKRHKAIPEDPTESEKVALLEEFNVAKLEVQGQWQKVLKKIGRGRNELKKAEQQLKDLLGDDIDIAESLQLQLS
ncbi:Cell cycle serine/threonine-protein kinase cdc5/MSD2 [Mortierella sp. NVP41]|nr:Cell cycle serine/threonine-protein kinase cdc5/MSD2 [Mortierella sp. NVP41]